MFLYHERSVLLTKDQKEQEQVMLVNLVENARPSVMANDPLAEDVFIPVVHAIMDLGKVGGRGSKCDLVIAHGLQLQSRAQCMCRATYCSTVSPYTNTLNRTAEDLSATSRRLARYESLLNNIAPLVSPSVRAMIDDARVDVSHIWNHDIDIGPNPSRTRAILLAQITPRARHR